MARTARIARTSRNAARSILAALGLACLAAQAAPQAYVSAQGNDARRCSLASPCRTFQAAHDAVDPGGEVIALDSADYGGVRIAKSVSLVGAPGFVASIEATGTGVLIEAPGAAVLLRHLSIRAAGGKRGIDMPQGASLTVEHCVVSGMSAEGLRVGAEAQVRIVASTFRANGTHGALLHGGTAEVVRASFVANGQGGLRVEADLGNPTMVAVADSVASGNGTDGFALRAMLGRSRMTLSRVTAANNAGAGIQHETVSSHAMSTVVLGGSTATGNGRGVANVISQFTTIPLLESAGDNLVRGNTLDVFGTITPISPL